MKLSYNWLKEYVDVKNSAKQVASWLTMAGLEVTSMEQKGKDWVFEIEVTTNRPDWLSIIGVARELSAITGKRLKPPLSIARKTLLPRQKGERPEVVIRDRHLCARYTARIIEGVKVGPSPKWLVDRLASVGLRSINNVVDITNFCLYELGQPLHAFDFETIKDSTIVVRRAKKGERIVTIDGIERKLSENILVIADSKAPVAIAGIMGGKYTEVTDSTRTILLESAYFDPVSVRKGARELGLTTESSYRFERRVDIEAVLYASNRAASLVVELCGGKIGELRDIGVKVGPRRIIKLSIERLRRVLDIEISPVVVKRILLSLGLNVGPAGDVLRVEVPSFRQDIAKEEDLFEEVARIYGYEKIPLRMPALLGHIKRRTHKMDVELATRNFLVGLGMDEIVTYSLISKDRISKIYPYEDVVGLKNPLSSQQEILRPTLIPGMLSVASYNLNRKIEDMQLFEFSKIYKKEGDKGYKEISGLSLLICGCIKGWRGKRQLDFFYLKGILESLFEKLGVLDIEYRSANLSIFVSGAQLELLKDDRRLGVMGLISSEIASMWEIKKEIIIAELDFDILFRYASLERSFTGIPKFLPLHRDISMVVDKSISSSELLKCVKGADQKLINSVELIDVYYGEQIPAGKKSLTVSVEYSCPSRQLTVQEIEPVHNRIKDILITNFGAIIR